jgi:hypothetical protein
MQTPTPHASDEAIPDYFSGLNDTQRTAPSHEIAGQQDCGPLLVTAGTGPAPESPPLPTGSHICWPKLLQCVTLRATIISNSYNSLAIDVR